MTLNQLECFMVLAQRLNFTQAADDLFMAQPALSRLISALEKELDLQLFYRNSRSVALTPAGTVFFKKCPKILDEYRGSVVAARLAQEGVPLRAVRLCSTGEGYIPQGTTAELRRLCGLDRASLERAALEVWKRG